MQANHLFIHSTMLGVSYEDGASGSRKRPKVVTKEVPELLTITVLNALVPNSAMLLIGGHGGAKTTLVKLLGRMFTGKSLDEIEESILRGHPQLTEEKILATLDLPRLMKGEEVVKWRSFVKDFWKLVDEVNRMTPYAQNILLSLLAERRVKFYDATREIPQYCLYATMNPQDAGTFDLPLPFLDRFGISLPFSMPTSHDLSLILQSKDDRLFGYDEFLQVPQVLALDDMMRIWRFVDSHPVNPEASELIQAIVREFSLCDRVNKGVSSERQVGPSLCSGCHFDTTPAICNKVTTILSVRAAKDLNRYAKALGWLVGVPVDIHLVLTVAPYVIQHRVDFVQSMLVEKPFFGDRLKFTRHLLDLLKNRFMHRKEMMGLFEEIKKGKGTPGMLDEFVTFGKNDLIVKLDYVPVATMLLADAYRDYVEKIETAYEAKDITALLSMKKELLHDESMMNKGELLSKISLHLTKLTLKNFSFPFRVWRDQVWADLATEFRYLAPELEKSLQTRVQKQLRTRDSAIGLIVTGNDDNSEVSLDISGGEDVKKIESILRAAGIMKPTGAGS